MFSQRLAFPSSGSESVASDEGILSPPPLPPSAEPSQPSKLPTPGARSKAAVKARPRAASVARQVYSQVVAGFGGAFFFSF